MKYYWERSKVIMDQLNSEDLKNLFKKLRFRDSAVTLLSVTSLTPRNKFFVQQEC